MAIEPYTLRMAISYIGNGPVPKLCNNEPWKKSAIIRPPKIPIEMATSASVLRAMSTITPTGTTNSQGVIVNDSFNNDCTVSISAASIAVSPVLQPKMVKSINEMIKDGMVV